MDLEQEVTDQGNKVTEQETKSEDQAREIVDQKKKLTKMARDLTVIKQGFLDHHPKPAAFLGIDSSFHLID